jgi:hypothetical protein
MPLFGVAEMQAAPHQLGWDCTWTLAESGWPQKYRPGSFAAQTLADDIRSRTTAIERD